VFGAGGIGGYGRAELNRTATLTSCSARRGHAVCMGSAPCGALVTVLFTLVTWVQVGHSVVRWTLREVANSDMQSKTSLIEAPRFWGRGVCSSGSASAAGQVRQGTENEYIQARLADQECGGQVRQFGLHAGSRTSRTAAAGCAITRICFGWRFSRTDPHTGGIGAAGVIGGRSASSGKRIYFLLRAQCLALSHGPLPPISEQKHAGGGGTSLGCTTVRQRAGREVSCRLLHARANMT